MKKSTYFASFIVACAPFALLAQPNITSADFPAAGAHWAELRDSRPGMHTVTPAGADKTWDYSTGYFLVDDTSFTSLIAPSSVPNGWGSNFPTADLAEYDATDSVALFYEVNTNGFYVDGQYDGTMNGSGKFDIDPNILYIPTPFTYNASRNSPDRIMFIIINENDTNYKYVNHVEKTITGDAYGTIKTPYATYNNTLRFHTFTYAYDSAFIDKATGIYEFIYAEDPKDTTNTYLWYSATQQSPVAKVDFEGSASNSVSTGATYFDFTLQHTGVKQVSAAKTVSVYPNPSINQPLYFSLKGNSAITNLAVYNVNGELIHAEQIEGFTQVVLQTNEMSAGLYFYALNDKNGKQIQNGKFIVAK